MSLPRNGWPSWTGWSWLYDPKPFVRWCLDRVLMPFLRVFWWDRGWGFGNPPWWTKDDLALAMDRARAMGWQLRDDADSVDASKDKT